MTKAGLKLKKLNRLVLGGGGGKPDYLQKLSVSKPNFARKYSLESSRRDLYNALLCTVLESNPQNQENHGEKRTWSNSGEKWPGEAHLHRSRGIRLGEKIYENKSTVLKAQFFV